MFQDIRYTLRSWSARPWDVVFAIIALAIGIGANIGVLSVMSALLFRPLPFEQPDRLALFRNFVPPHDTVKQFHDWAQQSPYLTDAAVSEEIDTNLGTDRTAVRVHLAQVSSNFFSVLGIRTILGQGFSPGDDVDGAGWGLPGRNAVAVISYPLWQQLFGGDRGALGATIHIDGTLLTIVGVMPPGFDYPGKAMLWKPAAFSQGNNGWATIGRLKNDIKWRQAQSAFEVEADRISPKNGLDDHVVRPSMTSLQLGLAGPAKNAFPVFMGAMGLVLLIACSNVASLLIARAADRLPELLTREALGASRIRLVRPLAIECLLLAVCASVCGLSLAYWIASIATRIEPPPLGVQSYSVFEPHVIAFAFGVCILTTLALSILPALYVGRIRSLRDRNFSGSRLARSARVTLVGAQVMLTVVLLASSVCLGSAFLRLMRTDRGYDTRGIVTVGVSLKGTTHELEKRQLPYFDEVIQKLKALHGVRSVSATEFLPLYASAFMGGKFGVDGHPATRNSTMLPVMADYFQTMGGRILYGREFTDIEVRNNAKVAVVNERFAASFGGPNAVIGHQLTIGKGAREIIGVVKGMEFETDPTLAHSNQVFVPSFNPGSFFSTFVVRVDGNAEDSLAEIGAAIQGVDPHVPVFGVQTMQQRLDNVFALPRFYRTAVWIFAAFALVLALIGIYGIFYHAVIERTREIGIRMALGRTPDQVRIMLMRQGLLIVAAGAIPGLAATRIATHFLEHLVQGAEPIGVTVTCSLFFLFVVITAVSIWASTHRTTKIDIVAMLRAEI
ncbi:MAG TPA: ABC transporter permease [Candidatus Angelobacter sp.]|jgi:predicted permease